MLGRIALVWSIINKVTGPHIRANSSFGKKHLAKKATERIHLLGMRCRGKSEGKDKYREDEFLRVMHRFCPFGDMMLGME